jgi:hypothetical protein
MVSFAGSIEFRDLVYISCKIQRLYTRKNPQKSAFHLNLIFVAGFMTVMAFQG